jgi:hypothetical protein
MELAGVEQVFVVLDGQKISLTENDILATG